MSKRIERDPATGKRVLRFVATSAVVVAPISVAACGGGMSEATNVDHHETTNVAPEEEHAAEEHTNVAPEEAPEATNVDHTAEPHSNVGPEDEAGQDSGGDEESPQ